ncbi:MAG: hypothetical protein K2Q45_02405 [Nitrosomonas sp.]|nr:hypothetical protein [Nitrosomonas sp.]
MKQQSNKVELLPYIEKKINDGAHLDLLIHRNPDIVKTVDFSKSTVNQVYSNNSYIIYLTSSLNPNKPVTVLFPNHENERKQVIKSKDYKFLSTFSKDINACLRFSLNSTDVFGKTQMAICYGNQIFICKDISGTVYILWASEITKINGANVANSLYQNVPVLINMDGQTRTKAVFILKSQVVDDSDLDRIPITTENPQIMYDKDKPLFVCEVRPNLIAVTTAAEEERNACMRMVSRKEALAIVTAPTSTTPNMYRLQPNRFAASIDMEEVINSDPDGGTPRPNQLYMRDVSIKSQMNVTPPLVLSENEEDPFAERTENIV